MDLKNKKLEIINFIINEASIELIDYIYEVLIEKDIDYLENIKKIIKS